MTTRPQYPAAWANYSPHQKLRWRKANETNATGYIGVKETQSGKFGAQIFNPVVGERVWIGTFDTAEEAGDAFDEAFLRIHGEEPDNEPDPDPEDREGLRDIMNMWPANNDPCSAEFNEMFEREVRPLLNFDDDNEEEEDTP